MSLKARLRMLAAGTHSALCLRWPTLLAIAVAHFTRRTPRSGTHSILVVRPDGLGDCILTLPLLKALKDCLPGAHLTVLTTPVSAPLFHAQSGADKVVVLRPVLSACWPKYLRGLLGALRAWSRHLRGRNFDVAILPRWDADIYHATLLCVLSRAPVRIGYGDATTAYKQQLCRGFARAWTVPLAPGPPRHEALRAREAAAALGCGGGDAYPGVSLSRSAREDARTWLRAALSPAAQGRMRIAVGLPAAEAKKRWPAALFIETLQAIAREISVAFILFADRDTAEAANLIHNALAQSCVASQLPLIQAAAVLGECTLFIGMDSGLGHLAAAVGCDTVTLFAQAASCTDHTGWHSNSPERFRPLSSHGIVVQPDPARPGCESGCCKTEPHCILDIVPGEVAHAARSLLSRTSPSATSL